MTPQLALTILFILAICLPSASVLCDIFLKKKKPVLPFSQCAWCKWWVSADRKQTLPDNAFFSNKPGINHTICPDCERIQKRKMAEQSKRILLERERLNQMAVGVMGRM
jgi:hypothetical protein